MPASWQSYLNEIAESSDEQLTLGHNEPESPDRWSDIDPLTRWHKQFRDRVERFEDWLGWTYVSWRRLGRFHRYQTRVERALVAMVCQRTTDYSAKTGRIYQVAASNVNTFGGRPSSLWLPDIATELTFSADLCVLLYSDLPVPKIIEVIPMQTTFEAAGIKEYSPDQHWAFPVIAIPRISFTRLKSVSGTPLVSSPPNLGSSVRLQSGKEVYGQSRVGILTPGTAAMFVERTGCQDPCLLGARHVFGAKGTVVLDSAQNKIGDVTLEDAILDVSVADLAVPWAVDYQLPGLNIIPGAPLMPYVNMPVQMFGARSGHQTGYVTQTNHTAPSQPGTSIANNILTSIQAQGGDSGGLLCSGYYAQPGLATPYLAGTSKSVLDAYTCAALGILQGRANQGVGPAVGLPTVFTLIQDILASLSLDPLIR
jgi:hypothetical protein